MMLECRMKAALLTVLMLLGSLMCPTSASAQAPQEGNSGVSQNAKGPAVAGRAPGLWVREALNGPEITQSEQEANQPSRLQRVYIDIIAAVFFGLNQLIPLLPELLPGQEGPVGIGDLIITEMANDGTNSFVEIYNPSSIRIELDNWAFCKEEECTDPGELAGRVMEPGDVVVLQLSGQFDSELANGVVTLQVNTTIGEIAIHDFTGADSRSPTDEVAIVDYLQWGDIFQSFGLEETAASVGLWVRGTSIASTVVNNSFQLDRNRIQTGGAADDYIVVPFEQHSLGQLTSEGLQPAGESTETISSAPSSLR